MEEIRKEAHRLYNECVGTFVQGRADALLDEILDALDEQNLSDAQSSYVELAKLRKQLDVP
jgi:hypothetical protein